MAQATSFDMVDPRFRADMDRLSHQNGAIRLGASATDPALGVFLDPAQLLGAGHGLVLGRTGTGKTRLVAGIIREILALRGSAPVAPSLMILDYKGDLAGLAHQIVAWLVDRLPTQAANTLIDALVVVDPFSTEALVPLNVLGRDQSSPVAPEVQAYEVASMFERMTKAPTGIVQDHLLFHLLLMAVCDGNLTLPDLVPMVMDSAARTAVAARSPNADVRAYFMEGRPVPVASAAGLQARFGRLLRLPATRAMLGARGCVDFRGLLRDKVVIVNLGSPPLGCEDIARWWGGLLMLKTTRAIFERNAEDAVRPVLLAVDEWQEGLAAAGDIADNYERVLAMARSKNVAALLMSQSLVGAAKVSTSLPKIVETNTSHQFLFSASPEDARAMAQILPVMGRMPRVVQPWEERPSSPYETLQTERDRLIDGATRLPDRQFYYWQRRAPYKAQLVRALDVDVEAPEFLPADRARRLRIGGAAIPLGELQKRAPADTPAQPNAIAAGNTDGLSALLGPSRWARGRQR